MLANLLSRKPFFVEIILGITFLSLFSLNIYQNYLFSEHLLNIIPFVLLILAGFIFFKTSKITKQSGFALFYYLGWMMVFSSLFLDIKICIAFLINTLMFWRMVHAEEHASSKKYSFDIGFCLGVSTFIYPPSILMLGLILVNYLYLQSLNLRILALFILGLIFPTILGVQILFLTDQMHWLVEFQSFFYRDFWSSNTIFILIPILILILISWFDHVSHASTQDINKRHIYFLFFLYFINWSTIIAIFGGENVNLLAILGFPISVFLGRFTQYQTSKIWKEIFLWIYLLTILGFYFRFEIGEFYQELLGNVRF